MKREKILVTSALPFANGPIHFGNIAGAYLPADIFVRFKRAQGADIVYVCGTDDHGVAITISAELEGVTPEVHTQRNYEVIKRIFDKFNIQFDHFSRTRAPHHHKLAQKFFMELWNNGHIEEKVTKQLYCTACERFLADRFVSGTCPVCGWAEARGDECTKCGKWLDPFELIDPRCKVCGATPIPKETRHWFLRLQEFSDQLGVWIAEKTDWKENVTTFVLGLIKEGLHARPVTRDMTWGVPVPLPEAEGKVLYVWFENVIGYISATVEWAERIGEPEKWREYWQERDTKLYHFIGKDNIPFHCIVWPSIIMGQDTYYHMPDDVPANEFYNLEGRQFSKSEGWYIDAEAFLDQYNTDSIRYTIASEAPESKDSEFTWKGYQARNNSYLANIYGNFVNRVLAFGQKRFDGKVPEMQHPGEYDLQVLEEARGFPQKIAGYLERFEVRRATFELMELARLGNKYFDEKAPWKAIKTDPADCAVTLHVCYQMVSLLGLISTPVMPETAAKIWKMLRLPDPVDTVAWDRIDQYTLKAGHQVGAPEVLFIKIEDEVIEAEIVRMKESFEQLHQPSSEDTMEPIKETISYDDFAKLDLRVGEIKAAEPVPKSKKLLKLSVKIGPEERQIIGGLADHYAPEELVGRQVIVVANLAPAKLMGLESQGMLLAAVDGESLALLVPDKKMPSGTSVS